MKTKYFNDAVIGNKSIIASYTQKGELLRLYYPTKDNKQFIDFFTTGVKVNDSNLINLHEDINNTYKQYYTEDTNILNTQIKNTYFNFKIEQKDFIPMNQNIVIKRYIFTNESNIDLDIDFLIYSKLLSDDNNMVSGNIIDGGILQYCHDYSLGIFATKEKLLSYQINDTKENIITGSIIDKDYIGMSSDSSISYKIGILKPQESKNIDICICIDNNKKENEDHIKDIKKLDFQKEEINTSIYWKKYVKRHDGINLGEIRNSLDKKMEQIYKRSILLFPLLTNRETGGIVATVEIDEKMTKCGRYSYCWPRDAVFITRALDILKMNKYTERFYKNFCKNTQSPNGMWEQRFYTDGTLAPCWGYQIDETASVVYGVYEHYKIDKDKKFLKDNLKMCEKASKYLKKYIENILLGSNQLHVSYDLWEMYEGIHLYSLASIFASFEAMINIYIEVEEFYETNRLKQEQMIKEKEELQKYLVDIKKYIMNNLYDKDKKCFVRNIEDKKMDISIIGSVVPFKIFTPKEKNILNTVERINLTLRTYTGGYKRFEQDHYMNGNPWTIATLWMALYYIESGEKRKAKELLSFVLKTSTELGFIAEQIDNETLKPAWVIGLGWAHAMFIIVLEKLFN